ncbi:TLD domain-containing protein 2-like isoform X1 [Erpetoichthys calabaricus]|nr:TLD domain-containing protein 2-like isoform X1 [Erpetoichthys calabaricus]
MQSKFPWHRRKVRYSRVASKLNDENVSDVCSNDKDNQEVTTERRKSSMCCTDAGNLNSVTATQFIKDNTNDFNEPILTEESKILSVDQINQIFANLPPRVTTSSWTLVYCTRHHGFSLRNLYRTSHLLDCSMLAVMCDSYNQVFGVFCSTPLRISRGFYGSGETFLFCFSPNLKVFKWTSNNSYFIKGNLESLVFGGGSGHFGLWLDEDLCHGGSNTCETFNNEILSKTQDFILKDLELWAFL